MRVDGSVTVDGVPAIEMTVGTTAEGDSVVLYVDPQTYLPMKEVDHSWYGQESNKIWTDAIDEFTFLAPTRTNLSQFKVEVPSGYTRLPQQPNADGLALTGGGGA